MRVLAPPPRINNKNNYEASPSSSSLQPPPRNIAQIPIEFDFEAAVQEEMRRLEQNFQALASNGGDDVLKKAPNVSFAPAAVRGGGQNTDSHSMSSPSAAIPAAEINLRNWQREGYPSEFAYAKAMGVLDAPPPQRSMHPPPTMQQPSKFYRSPGTDDLHAPVKRQSPAYAAADDQPIANNSLMVGGMMNSAEQAAALRKRQQAEYAQQLRSDSSNNLRMDQGMSKHQQHQPPASSNRPGGMSGSSPSHGNNNTNSSNYLPQKGAEGAVGSANRPPYSPNRDRVGGGGGGKYSPDRGGGGGGGSGKYSPGRAAKWAAAEAEAELILRREEEERLGRMGEAVSRYHDTRPPPPQPTPATAHQPSTHQPSQRYDYDNSTHNGHHRSGGNGNMGSPRGPLGVDTRHDPRHDISQDSRYDSRPDPRFDQRTDPRYDQRGNNNAHSNNTHGGPSGIEQRGNGNTSPARVRLVTDIYGSSSVVGTQPPSPQRWRPSQVGEDMERKKIAALEMRRALDEQIEVTKRRKAEEKQKEMEKEEKLNAKAARDAAELAAQIKADKDAQRLAAKDELQKMSELQNKDTQAALARKNMKGKELSVVSPSVNNNPHTRPGPLPGRDEDRDREYDRDRDYDRERERERERGRERDVGGMKQQSLLRDESNQSLPGHSLVVSSEYRDRNDFTPQHPQHQHPHQQQQPSYGKDRTPYDPYPPYPHYGEDGEGRGGDVRGGGGERRGDSYASAVGPGLAPGQGQGPSPTKARMRLVTDMYGASSVLGGQGQVEAPGANWRPSNVGEDGDRKKLAAKEHKRILDEQIAEDRRRKAEEKRLADDNDRLADERENRKMQMAAEEDRGRMDRKAKQASAREEQQRIAELQEKQTKEALARKNKPDARGQGLGPGQPSEFSPEIRSKIKRSPLASGLAEGPGLDQGMVSPDSPPRRRGNQKDYVRESSNNRHNQPYHRNGGYEDGEEEGEYNYPDQRYGRDPRREENYRGGRPRPDGHPRDQQGYYPYPDNYPPNYPPVPHYDPRGVGARGMAMGEGARRRSYDRPPPENILSPGGGYDEYGGSTAVPPPQQPLPPQQQVVPPPPQVLYSSLASLAAAMGAVGAELGGGKKYRSLEAQAVAEAKFAHAQGLARANRGEPGGGGDGNQSNHQSNPVNAMRRAATPGGALESESRFTDEHTMAFLSRPNSASAVNPRNSQPTPHTSPTKPPQPTHPLDANAAANGSPPRQSQMFLSHRPPPPYYNAAGGYLPRASLASLEARRSFLDNEELAYEAERAAILEEASRLNHPHPSHHYHGNNYHNNVPGMLRGSMEDPYDAYNPDVSFVGESELVPAPGQGLGPGVRDSSVLLGGKGGNGMPRPPHPHARPGPGPAPGPGLGFVSEVEKSLASESLLLYVGDATPRLPKHNHLLNSYVGGESGASRLAQSQSAEQLDSSPLSRLMRESASSKPSNRKIGTPSSANSGAISPRIRHLHSDRDPVYFTGDNTPRSNRGSLTNRSAASTGRDTRNPTTTNPHNPLGSPLRFPLHAHEDNDSPGQSPPSGSPKSAARMKQKLTPRTALASAGAASINSNVSGLGLAPSDTDGEEELHILPKDHHTGQDRGMSSEDEEGGETGGGPSNERRNTRDMRDKREIQARRMLEQQRIIGSESALPLPSDRGTGTSSRGGTTRDLDSRGMTEGDEEGGETGDIPLNERPNTRDMREKREMQTRRMLEHQRVIGSESSFSLPSDRSSSSPLTSSRGPSRPMTERGDSRGMGVGMSGNEHPLSGLKSPKNDQLGGLRSPKTPNSTGGGDLGREQPYALHTMDEVDDPDESLEISPPRRKL